MEQETGVDTVEQTRRTLAAAAKLQEASGERAAAFGPRSQPGIPHTPGRITGGVA
ncbi:hypothetical protein [Streptomyces sp. PA5.6]|uniref:hypothetical protein n=1 Tax=Streptomyces sp. PA5.6 TaxID=3035651 RepID=UPI0039049A25